MARDKLQNLAAVQSLTFDTTESLLQAACLKINEYGQLKESSLSPMVVIEPGLVQGTSSVRKVVSEVSGTLLFWLVVIHEQLT